MIFRVLFFLFIYLPFLILVIPLQWLVLKLGLPIWTVLPRAFHRLGCLFLGLRVTVVGTPSTGRPTLLVSNHISWTDIVAIGSVADVTFVAKREVGEWFFVGMMARLQRTIFVDRTRRSDAGRTAQEMGRHMARGNAVLLFCRGPVGHRHPCPALPLGAGGRGPARHDRGRGKDVLIQPLTIAYTRLQGLPSAATSARSSPGSSPSRSSRNIHEILSGPVKDVTVAFGTPCRSANRTTARK